MNDDDRFRPYPDLDFFDEGSSRFFHWCATHWRATVAVVAGTPVLVGGAIGFILGQWVF